MWKSGFENNQYYYTCKIEEKLASSLYSFICNNQFGRSSATQCLNHTVEWLSGDYNFIIFGKDKDSVSRVQKVCDTMLNKY